MNIDSIHAIVLHTQSVIQERDTLKADYDAQSVELARVRSELGDVRADCHRFVADIARREMSMRDVISIRPQLLCGKLSRELGRYIESDPGASPAEMLELCNQIFAEIGAVQVDGVWTLPADLKGEHE